MSLKTNLPLFLLLFLLTGCISTFHLKVATNKDEVNYDSSKTYLVFPYAHLNEVNYYCQFDELPVVISGNVKQPTSELCETIGPNLMFFKNTAGPKTVVLMNPNSEDKFVVLETKPGRYFLAKTMRTDRRARKQTFTHIVPKVSHRINILPNKVNYFDSPPAIASFELLKRSMATLTSNSAIPLETPSKKNSLKDTLSAIDLKEMREKLREVNKTEIQGECTEANQSKERIFSCIYKDQ